MGVAVEERDFFKDRLTVEEVRRLASLSSADEMFSWNSPSAREYRHRRGRLLDEELIQLMATEPRLIRRPVLVRGDRVRFGYRAGDYGRA